MKEFGLRWVIAQNRSKLISFHIIYMKSTEMQVDERGVLSVKQLMNLAKKMEVEKEKKAVLRLEMDYELATLFDAMNEKDEKQKKLSKQKLERIRQELLRLKAL
jgi:hypothetical protein